jgi:LmbE family N-acetylglucosaminyl deacetylase
MLPTDCVLVLAPHADDEALGCGGWLSRLAASGRTKLVLSLVSCSDVSVHHGTGEARDVDGFTRWREFQAVGERLGAITVGHAAPEAVTRKLHLAPDVTTAWVDGLIDYYQPTLVLAPGRSFHQDHVAVNRAAFAALRPGHASSVKALVLFETPWYAVTTEEDRFTAIMWIAFSEDEVAAKLRVCAVYVSPGLDTWRMQAAVERLMVRRGCEMEAVAGHNTGILNYAEPSIVARHSLQTLERQHDAQTQTERDPGKPVPDSDRAHRPDGRPLLRAQ